MHVPSRYKLVASVALYLSCCIVTTVCNKSSQMCAYYRKCAVRHEIHNETHALLKFTTCSSVINYHCICQETIHVLFTEFPPYIYTEPETKKVVGLIPAQARAATIITPIVSFTGSKSFLDSAFIELLSTRGVAYVTTKETNLDNFVKFGFSILSNWPLFFISVLFALNAGIMIWLLDSCYNEDEFPLSFHKGVIEGLWWAYVTMTTVGYGDKTPKSLPARLVSIVFIFAGVAFSAIFTASLTTGMTRSLNPETVSLDGKTIGVINHTRYEFQIAMREGANVKVFMNYHSLKAALKTKLVEGILVDIYVLSYWHHDLLDSIDNLHIRTDAIENTKTSYGIAFPYDLEYARKRLWAHHLAEFFRLHPVVDNEKAGKLSIFNSSKIYKLLFKYIGVATLIFIAIGLFVEKMRLAGKVYVASRQEKCLRNIETFTGEMKVGPMKMGEMKNGELEVTPLGAIVDVSTIRLRKKFQLAMKEIEIEEGNADFSNITEKLLQRVFSDALHADVDNDVINVKAIS
eukprot:gene11372-12557_t